MDTDCMALLYADQHQRWQQGDRVRVEAYLEAYPALRDDPGTIGEMIANEIILRKQSGEIPQLNEYLQRFPELAEVLRNKFDSRSQKAGGAPADAVRANGQEVPAQVPRIRRKTKWTLGTGVAFVLGCLTTAMFYENRAPDATDQRGLARRHLYVADMIEADRDWLEGRLDRGLKLLGEYQNPDAEDLRSFEWYYLSRLYHGELTNFWGHRGPVGHVAFSPDGERLASLSQGSVKVWKARSSQQLFHLNGPSNYRITNIAFSPAGDQLATALSDGTVQVCDGSTGEHLRTFRQHTQSVLSVAFSPDGRQIASAGLEDVVRLWDPRTGRKIADIVGKGPFNNVAFSPDGRRLATTSTDGAIKVWAIDSGKLLNTLKGAGLLTVSVAFDPDGSRLAAGGTAGVRVWDLRTDTESVVLRGNVRPPSGVAFSPDGGRLATWNTRVWDFPAGLAEAAAGWPTAPPDFRVHFWDAHSGEEQFTLQGHANMVNAVTFSSDNIRVATASEDGTVKVWSVMADQGPFSFRCPAFPNSNPSTALHIDHLEFSPDGKYLTLPRGDTTVRVWEVDSGRVAAALIGHGAPVAGAAFSPDGLHLASADNDGTIKIWDLNAHQEVLSFGGPGQGGFRVIFSPDGSRLASADVNGTVRVWDAGTGAEITSFEASPGPMATLAFSPDSEALAAASVGGDSRVTIWNAHTGRKLLTLKGNRGSVTAVAFSPDGSHLATAQDRTIKVWDRHTGQETAAVVTHAALAGDLVFSPDGRRLASGGTDQFVRLWDVRTGQETLALGVDRQITGGVAFSRDGRRLAALGAGRTVFLWEAAAPPEQALIQRQVYHLVVDLFRRLGCPEDVLDHLRRDSKLPAPLRQPALSLAEHYHPDPNSLNNDSWLVACRADADPAAYQRAWKKAEFLCRIAPNNGYYVNTLGVAQYRIGKYQEAWKTLAQSDQLNSGGSPDGSIPADLAFIAMAQFQLGQRTDAQRTLDRLRKSVGQTNPLNSTEAQGFLREAEALIQRQEKSGK